MTLNQIYDGIRDYIDRNLKRYLDPIDDVTTPMFKSILRSSVIDIMGLRVFPTLMMEYGRVEVERDTTSSDFYYIPITFYCINAGGDSEKLQTLSERYVWALKRLFEYDPSLEGLVQDSAIQGYEFSPSLNRQQTFIHVGMLDVTFNVQIARNKEEK